MLHGMSRCLYPPFRSVGGVAVEFGWLSDVETYLGACPAARPIWSYSWKVYVLHQHYVELVPQVIIQCVLQHGRSPPGTNDYIVSADLMELSKVTCYICHNTSRFTHPIVKGVAGVVSIATLDPRVVLYGLLGKVGKSGLHLVTLQRHSSALSWSSNLEVRR